MKEIEKNLIDLDPYPQEKSMHITTGMTFLIISLTTFVLTMNKEDTYGNMFSGIFFLSFCLTLAYFVILLSVNRQNTKAYFKFFDFKANVILLQLFNISAYALNRNFTAFSNSATWVVWFLVISNTLLMAYALFPDKCPYWLKHLVAFVSILAILFHTYQLIYLLPAMGLAVVTFWFFGIPLHAFVPFLYILAFIKVLRLLISSDKYYGFSSALSGLLSVAIIFSIVIRFNQINAIAHEQFHYKIKTNQTQNTPNYIAISQVLPKDWLTERILKMSIELEDGNNGFDIFGGRRTDKIHDPLMVIGSFFCSEMEIEEQDRSLILKTLFNERHKTEPKLWTGRDLITANIFTNIELFPSYRMAYTEKTIQIKNNRKQSWNQQQEALYTFYLPEGSVVTSAALWIDGIEQPAYLTTKDKADSAYRTIVKKEKRDPLLIHWQEGNRVTLRVFPCTPSEIRQFKIGITSPLNFINSKLSYQNIDFDGPYWKGCTESIQIQSHNTLKAFESNIAFKTENLKQHYKGSYQSQWYMSFTAPPLSKESFQFGNQNFSMEPYTKTFSQQAISDVYLDINANWKKEEIKQIWASVPQMNILVYVDGHMQQLNKENHDEIAAKLTNLNFTLFPFDLIKNPDKSLVITKFNQLTPVLSDLEGSRFGVELNNFFKSQHAPIKVVNIGNEVTPYMKSLKEFRSIQLEQISPQELYGMLKNGKYCVNEETENKIVNSFGGFKITSKQSDSIASNHVPDHLMRFFAYNKVMKAVGKDFFQRKQLENRLLPIAEQAHVVTPISSLVVLETQQDYDRFDIKQNQNSLKNASIGDAGSVPEPHEWVLIITIFLTALFFYFKR